jgi:hypothetical protein
MKNNYFTRDDFVTRFEVELRKTVDMERERDNFELKVRRKKKSRSNHGSKRDLRQPLDDVKSNSGMEGDDRYNITTLIPRSIPPIGNKAAYLQQGMKGMGITNAMTTSNAGGHHSYSHHGYNQHKEAMQMPTPAYAGHHKKIKGTVVSQHTLTFPKIVGKKH